MAPWRTSSCPDTRSVSRTHADILRPGDLCQRAVGVCCSCDTTGKTPAVLQKRVKRRSEKYLSLRKSEQRLYLATSRLDNEDVSADRHLNVGRDAMDARAQDDCASAYGQAVWSCPPDAGVNPRVKSPGETEANKPGTPGRSRSSRSTIARGMPDVSA